jgi:hypothetical protein
MPSSAFSGPLLRSYFIHVKIVCEYFEPSRSDFAGGGLGHIAYDFFLGGCQTDDDTIIMPFQEFISPRQG